MVVIGQIGVEPQRLTVAGFAGCRDRVQNAGFAWPDRAVVRRPRLEHVGHRPEITRPLGVCHPWPRPTVERPTCGTDDQVHIRGLRFGNWKYNCSVAESMTSMTASEVGLVHSPSMKNRPVLRSGTTASVIALM